MKRTFIFIFFVLTSLLSTSLSSLVHAQETPDLQVYFTPEIWAPPGSAVRVTAEIANPTVQDITDATLTVSFGGGAYFVSPTISADGGFVCTMLNTLAHIHMEARCTGGIVPAGETVKIEFADYAPDAVLYGYGIPMTATGLLAPYGVTSQADIVIVDEYKPELYLDANTSLTTVLTGQKIDYSVQVLSGGPVATTATTLKVLYPDGTMEERVVPPMGVGAGQKTTFLFSYVPTISGSMTTTFIVDLDNLVDEKYETNNISAVTTQVIPAMPDLTVEQTQAASVVYGGFLTREVRVKNIGNAIATNIRIQDSFSYMGIDSVVADKNFACAASYNRVGRSSRKMFTGYTCTGGGLAPGETATITAKLNPLYKVIISNNVRVDPTNLIKESDETNNVTGGLVQVY